MSVASLKIKLARLTMRLSELSKSRYNALMGSSGAILKNDLPKQREVANP